MMPRRPKHAEPKWTRYITAKYRVTHGSSWGPLALGLLLPVVSIVKGLDRVMDPKPPSEIMYFVEIIGSDTWGWAIVVTSMLVLLCIAARFLFGLIVFSAISAAVWAGFAVATSQGVAFAPEGVRGLRFVADPVLETGLFLCLFLMSVTQMTRIVEEDTP